MAADFFAAGFFGGSLLRWQPSSRRISSPLSTGGADRHLVDVGVVVGEDQNFLGDDLRLGHARARRGHQLLLAIRSGRSLRASATPSWRTAAENVFFLFFILDLIRIGGGGLFLVIVVDVFGAVPEAVAVVFVYRPAAILVVLVLLVRPLAAAETTEIIRIVVIGESVRLSCLITARHSLPLYRYVVLVQPRSFGGPRCTTCALSWLRASVTARLTANTAPIKWRQVDNARRFLRYCRARKARR